MLGQRSKSRKRGVEAARTAWAVAALALAIAVGARSASLAADPIVTDDVIVSVSGAGVANNASGEVRGVELRIEASDDQAASAHGFRSMASTVDIDCNGERDRVRSARAYDLPKLAGPSHPRPVSGQWVRPNPEAYLAKVIGEVCAREGLQPAGATAMVAAEPRRRGDEVGPQAGATAIRTTRLVADLSAPAPAVASRAVAGTSAGHAALPPQTPPASAIAAGGRYRAQLASNDSRQAAQAVLDRLGAEVRPPLAGEVQVANVRGRTVYRSIVANFAAAADAQAFCTRMRSAGRACIVWSGAAE
jgi:hypothetical protein